MRNKTIQGIIVVTVLGVLLACSLAYFTWRRIDSGIAASIQHKSAKRAVATVASVQRVSLSKKSQPDERDMYTVCFTIDNFDDVEPDTRPGYQAAESRRYSQEGPRCKETVRTTIATDLRVGNKLDIVYLLENEYKIDIVTVSTHGNEL